MLNSNLSNQQIIDRWLQDYARSSRYTYTYSYEFLMEVVNAKALVQLTASDVEKVQAEILRIPPDQEAKKTASLARLRSIGIRSLLKFMFEENIHSTDLSLVSWIIRGDTRVVRNG